MTESAPDPGDSTTAAPEPASPVALPEIVPDTVFLYVCPGCGSFYGSSSAPDLAKSPNTRTSLRNLATEDPSEWGKVAGHRIECQICKGRGKTVQRLLLPYVRLDMVQHALDEGIETLYQEEEKRSGTKLQRPTT